MMHRVSEPINPIVVSVVGPSNHGKTSVLRTLSEDSTFAVVDDRPGTTKLVRKRSIQLRTLDVMHLCDTPGFQVSDQIVAKLKAPDDGNILNEIIETAHDLGEAAHDDYKAWYQIKNSHVLFLVIDVTQSPEGRFNQDLRLMSRCGKPSIVLLNFKPSQQGEVRLWKENLRGYNFHVISEYDADRRRTENEVDLYQRIANVLDDKEHQNIATQLSHLCRDRAQQRLEQACRRVAELAMDVAQARVVVPNVTLEIRQESGKKAEKQLYSEIQTLEAATWEYLCDLWKFKRS